MSARSTDTLITSLKVIAQLRQHERVCTRGEIVRVDRSGRGLWQSALRWLNDENRTHNLDHIDAIVQNAIDTLDARVDESEVHIRIDRELENTMRGIENLKITYEDCSVSTAKLDLILDKMSERRRVSQTDQPSQPRGKKRVPRILASRCRRGMMREKEKN